MCSVPMVKNRFIVTTNTLMYVHSPPDVNEAGYYLCLVKEYYNLSTFDILSGGLTARDRSES